ncbi:uncharacterized protein LOC110669437 [Hevea brasiliensis]|uniref:uncharacterized protein LOC110669437 n=1 Tax=Hevea brasiliensis TaxID=3981 RepID=UPI0025EBB061|nr:uncharacterized protein LOC110669437 [Hevea brasiliensis]
MGWLKSITSQHSPTEKEEEEKEKEREYLQQQSAASQFAAQKKKKKKKKKKQQQPKGERQSTEKQETYTRVRAHLLKITGKEIGVCKKVMNDSISKMRKQEDEATNKITNSQSRRVSLPISITSVLSLNITEPSISAALKKRRVNDSPLGRAFDLQTRAQLDAEIARMFYTGGLPFNFARNPYYVSSYSFAANHVLGGYVPPDYNKLRTTLLQQEKANVERLLEPIKSTWLEKGVSIVSDGWSDPQRRPLINFMVVSESGPMFIKSVDCSGEVKDKQFIANLLKEVIDEQMETNQETSDVCHWITEIHGDVLQIKNFIMNHSMRLAIYNWFSPLKLLSVADTRFASIVVMLKRFKLIRRALEAIVMSDQWAQYQEDDQGKARFVRDKVVDKDWWENVDYIIAFTGPIYDMIKVCDTDKPCLHLVYELWDSMIEKVKQVIFYHEEKQADGFSPFYYVVHRILVDRWAKSNTPLHYFTVKNGFKREKVECLLIWMENEPFADPDSIGSMYVTDPRKWWACFGSNAPLLQRRNKLTPKRTENLVFIHNNLRLLSRNSSQYYDEKTKLWDIGGDQFGSMEDVGVLEFANLSLDEPELESILFDENATTSTEKEKDSEVEEMS